MERPQIVLDGSLKDLAKLNKWMREDAKKSVVVKDKKTRMVFTRKSENSKSMTK